MTTKGGENAATLQANKHGKSLKVANSLLSHKLEFKHHQELNDPKTANNDTLSDNSDNIAGSCDQSI